jgi:PAS domain S-box-containing protein
MGEDKGQEDGSSPTAPFGIDLSMAVIERATRLANGLFGDSFAIVVLMHEGEFWRSRYADNGLPMQEPVAELIIREGKPLWIEDASRDPVHAHNPLVIGPPFLKFYVGAPIRLADGSTPGVLSVMGVTPRPFDAAKLARLSDIADFLADEWERAQAKRAHSRSSVERDAARTMLIELVKGLPMSLVLTDRNMAVIAHSDRWASELVLDEQPTVGRSIFELSPMAYEPWRQPLQDCLAEGRPVSAQRLRSTRSDGAVAWLNTEVKPWRDSAGEIGGLMIAADNITELVETLEQVEHSEARLKLALGLADVHVWEMDYQRRELLKTGAEETFFEQPCTYEQLYTDIYDTIDPRDRPEVEEQWRIHIEEGAPYHPQYRIKRTDDKEIWVESAVTLLNDQKGRTVRLVGALQNITARKLAEQALVRAKDQAEAANMAKSTFLATMSHEIRTPLNGVLGMAQIMDAAELSDPQRERLQVIRKSGEALLAILNDVLDLSTIEAARLELEEAPFNIADLARGAHAAFSSVAAQKGLAFDLTIEDQAQGTYLGDSTRVRQILYNMVSNALKFTDRGEVLVRIAATHAGMTLTVKDTGIGIAPERLGQLFQKFEQVDASVTRRFGGAGLGLAICRELALLMGGAVTVESRQDEGSTFTATLPLKRIADRAASEAQAGDEALADQANALPALRVLAAEDNSINQLVLRTMLQQAGVDPTIVADGREALDAWRRADWDLVLMDIQMPEMDGLTATRAIRDSESETGRRRTPIIALTANAMAHHIAEYAAGGMDGFVAKPIEVGRLFAAMDAALDDHGEQQRAIAS